MNSAGNCIDGKLFEKILTFGALNLQANAKEINDLNVFPVPDGDTGDNMCATLLGGIDCLKKEDKETLDKKAGALAEGMLLNARGNSGVILSQLFYGIAQGLMGLKVATLPEFACSLKKGVEVAYKAVVKPVEGTILTVARESAEKVCQNVTKDTTLQQFFADYLTELKCSLSKTPELLKVLKESGVVDSGGAGLVCIAEGFYKAIMGDESFEQVALTSVKSDESVKTDIHFDRASKMDYGYCTEALVQLLDSKNGVENFDLDTFIEFLNGLGDSVVVVQTDDKVKVHVHTLTPAKVIAECQKYGEFISVKIENMTLQHNNLLEVEEKKSERVSVAVVAVASGKGFEKVYKELGADYIVYGGQTDNPSAEEFIKGFEQVNADTIFVLPNNKNIVLSAKQAKELYKNSRVIVVPTVTPQQVYCALSVYTQSEDVETTLSDMEEACSSVDGYSITYAVRDAIVNGVEIKKGDYMSFCNCKLAVVEQDLLDCFKKTIDGAEDIDDKEIITIFYGKTVTEEQKQTVQEFIEERLPDAELIEYDGEQEVYPFIIALE